MFRTYWDMKVSQAKENAAAIKTEMAQAEAQIERLVNRIVEATNDRAIGALENRIGELEQRKLLLAEREANSALPQPSFNECLELSLQFLANPYKIWASGAFEIKRMVLKLVFPEGLHYDRNNGYRTPAKASVFSVFSPNPGKFLPDLGDGAAGEN